jgi:transposase-like protein
VKHSDRPRPWLPPRWAFAGFRFPTEVIVVAVRWYLRFNPSYRDVEELLVERGVEVDHVSVFRWVQRCTPLLADAARFRRHSPGDRWFVDETYVTVNGVWRYVYRAVDQHGQVIDVLVSVRRDADAARPFFRRALTTRRVAAAGPTSRREAGRATTPFAIALGIGFALPFQLLLAPIRAGLVIARWQSLR